MTTNFTNDQGTGVVVADGFTGGTLTTTGYITRTPQLVAAAGTNSQANATAITNSMVFVTTVSATTRGVRLPAAVTGLQVQVNNNVATAVKVYPATGDKIGTGATNAAVALAASKGNIYTARDAVTWSVVVGG